MCQPEALDETLLTPTDQVNIRLIMTSGQVNYTANNGLTILHSVLLIIHCMGFLTFFPGTVILYH